VLHDRFQFFAYAIRHTFITDALRQGCNPVTLAHIVGHKDATMILKIYQHLNLNSGHIRKALGQATGEGEIKEAM
jgi:integrase